MKTTAIQWMAGLVLATTACAGTPATVTSAPPSMGLWTWFAGGSVGYLTDLEQPMYSLNLGMEYKQPGAQGSHSIYLQVGYAEDDASFGYHPGIPGAITEDASIDMHIVPITLNYKYEGTLSGRLNYYAGLGLGIAVVDTSWDWSWSKAIFPGGEGKGSADQTGVRFYGEILAGLSYHVTDAFQVYAGARYIWMNDMDSDTHVTRASYDSGLNHNVLLELGLRYSF